MQKLAFILVALSILLTGARLSTGVIWLEDEPTAVLVLKHRPAPWIERPEVQGERLSKQTWLDSEEGGLSYPYIPLMRAVPVLVPGLAVLAGILLAVSRRRRTCEDGQ